MGILKFNFLKKNFFSKKNESFNSKKYWEKRYSDFGNSGPGSYGNLALFKAAVINNFVAENDIFSVIELGCGDGNQLSLFNFPYYVGTDVSNTALDLCREKFENDRNKIFYSYKDFKRIQYNADLTLSLDVIYHLIENHVFHEYMVDLFDCSKKFVIIYSSNRDEVIAKHVKCRKFTDWVEKYIGDKFELVKVIKNLYPFKADDPINTSYSDFFIYKRKI